MSSRLASRLITSRTAYHVLQALLKANYVVHAIDLRGHGATQTSNDADLSIETLVEDMIAVIARIVPESEAAGDASEAPQTVIVGHRCALSFFTSLGSLVMKTHRLYDVPMRR